MAEIFTFLNAIDKRLSLRQETLEGQRSSPDSARRADEVYGRAELAGAGVPAVFQIGPDTLPDSGSHHLATEENTVKSVQFIMCT